MITLKQNCKDGAKYFQYRKKNTFIRVYVKLNKDKNSIAIFTAIDNSSF